MPVSAEPADEFERGLGEALDGLVDLARSGAGTADQFRPIDRLLCAYIFRSSEASDRPAVSRSGVHG